MCDEFGVRLTHGLFQARGLVGASKAPHPRSKVCELELVDTPDAFSPLVGQLDAVHPHDRWHIDTEHEGLTAQHLCSAHRRTAQRHWHVFGQKEATKLAAWRRMSAAQHAACDVRGVGDVLSEILGKLQAALGLAAREVLPEVRLHQNVSPARCKCDRMLHSCLRVELVHR